MGLALPPRNLPAKFEDEWAKPWRREARNNKDFKRWLLQHGYLSPHFRVAEASGASRHPKGTDVPKALLDNAQRHAFELEVFRHELGDVPISPGSWYRNPTHNSAVGGADQSRHLEADATDWFTGVVNRVGAAKFDRIANEVFAEDGFGVYPSGSRHLDSRGFRARW